MKGVKRKKKNRAGAVGKRYIKVTKSIVEYVICPDIFQKKVMIVIIEDTTKIFRDTLVRVSILRGAIRRKIIPNNIVIVVK